MNPTTAPAPGPAPEPAAARYERMFNAAVCSLAEISKALGISDEEAATANGNDLILERIAELRRPAMGNYRSTIDMRGHTVVEECRACINGLSAWVMVADLGKEHPEDEMFGGLDRETLARCIVHALGVAGAPDQTFRDHTPMGGTKC